MSDTTEDGAPDAGNGVEIRALESLDDYRACEKLQADVWGRDFADRVPASVMKVARKVGGVCAGAVSEEGELVGFVFGLTGLREGTPVHWSHMLAVRREHRGRGIGGRLKEHQRSELLGRGVATCYWTFDPLVAGNAHFNLNRLGVRVAEYVPDMYGETGSRLHRGLGTDRFVVRWDLEGYEPGRSGPPLERPPPDAPVLNPGGRLPERPDAEEGSPRPVALVEVPPDIFAVRDEDPEAARAWRRSTRAAFTALLEAGGRVAGLAREPESGHCFYRVDAGG